MVVKEDLRNALKELGLTETDIDQALAGKLAGSFGPLYANKYRAIPLDEFFYSYLVYKDPTTGAKTILDKQRLSTYWYVDNLNWQNSYIAPPSPPQNHFFAIYTRNSWKYPWGGVYAKLPALPLSGSGPFDLFGFEPGSGSEWGLIAYWMGGSKFYAHCDGGDKSMDLTSSLPSDYSTAVHRYMIKVNRPTAEFYIDGVLVAVAIRQGISFTSISGPPYAVFGTTMKGFDEAPAFIEFNYASVDKYRTDPIQFRAMDGDPLPPRAYPLYLAGSSTKFAGYSVASGSVTSHPVPTFGYAGKILYFMANQAGTLLIEVLTPTGNWRTYDTDTVLANTLWWYKMTGDAVLARLTFTPSTYPCTISEAGICLS